MGIGQDPVVTDDNAGVQRPIGDEEVRLWAEPGGPIMLKAVNAHGDPVELNGGQARRTAEILLRLADRVEAS